MGASLTLRTLQPEATGAVMEETKWLKPSGIRSDDWARTQELADGLSPDTLHAVLDRYAQQCCPVLDVFGRAYHWSLMQVEYAPCTTNDNNKRLLSAMQPPEARVPLTHSWARDAISRSRCQPSGSCNPLRGCPLTLPLPISPLAR